MTDSESKKILLVDDAPDTIEVLKRNLESKGNIVFTSYSVQEAIKVLKKVAVDLVITDYKMPGATGFELIRHVKENYKETEIMMITGYATIEGAVNAVKSGAEEYLSKPFTDEELYKAVERAFHKLELRLSATKDFNEDEKFEGIWGSGRKAQKLKKEIKTASKNSEPLLITGSQGTETDETAISIHRLSNRSSKRFLTIDFETVNGKNAIRELDGYERKKPDKSFQPGFLDLTSGGTLYLKNIEFADEGCQKYLLKLIKSESRKQAKPETKGNYARKLLFSSEVDLQELIKADKFNEDLYFLISKYRIEIPALKERKEDITVIIHQLINYFSEKYYKPKISFSDYAINLLTEYEWTNNYREIKSLIKFLTLSFPGKIIDAPDLPAIIKSSISENRVYNKTLLEIEQEYVKGVLKSVNNNKSKAAKILNLDRKTIREKLK